VLWLDFDSLLEVNPNFEKEYSFFPNGAKNLHEHYENLYKEGKLGEDGVVQGSYSYTLGNIPNTDDFRKQARESHEKWCNAYYLNYQSQTYQEAYQPQTYQPQTYQEAYQSQTYQEEAYQPQDNSESSNALLYKQQIKYLKNLSLQQYGENLSDSTNTNLIYYLIK
jgi:hypothetical protein